MRCGDLERYLEAFLDGRLTRSRAAVLRRHLALCGTCQARMEHLRQFERDMQRRLRALEVSQSIWHGLELDLVGSDGAVKGGHLLPAQRPAPELPPPRRLATRAVLRQDVGQSVVTIRPRGRAAASRLAGVLIVALVLGAAYQMIGREQEPSQEHEALLAYLDHQRDTVGPDLRSGDPERVGQWLAGELGRQVQLPHVPQGFRLVGASRAAFTSGMGGALVYERDGDGDPAPVMLFLRPGPIGATPLATPVGIASGGGIDAELREVAWEADNILYTAVGPLPEAELYRFAD